jgi:hypothetical protein
MQAWAAHELQTAALGDTRRGNRLVRLVEALADQPAVSVPRACGSWAATKAAYRFWDNPHITPDAIRAAHTDATRQRVRPLSRILAVQDTTELDWSHHPATTELGPLSAPAHQGLHVHSTLAVTTDGVPVGLLDQQVWSRDPAQTGKRHTRRQRPTAEKESQRWLDALTATLQALPDALAVVTVADREADIYDLFAQPRRTGAELLIRATHNRKVVHDAGYLWDAVQAAPVQATRTLEVGRTPLREPRAAQLELRWVALELEPPRHQVGRTHRHALPVVAVRVSEVQAPVGSAPLHWLLLTTLAVPDAARAWELVAW